VRLKQEQRRELAEQARAKLAHRQAIARHAAQKRAVSTPGRICYPREIILAIGQGSFDPPKDFDDKVVPPVGVEWPEDSPPKKPSHPRKLFHHNSSHKQSN